MKITLPRLLALVTEHQQLGAESNTAVHRHRAPGHPTRLVGGKKQHGPDEIVGLSKPPERDHCLCRTPCFGICIARARKSGSVGPGAIALTRMPCAARSTAIACVSERAPPFEAT